MQYDIEESGLSVTMTAANFDVAVTASAPLEVAVGECARIDVGEAVNYIKSGQAEIGAAVDIGVNRIASSVNDGISDFNLNALNKTNAFNQNATGKTGDFDAHVAVKKAEIDADVALAKQWAVGEPTEPTGYSAKYWAENAAGVTSGLADRVTTIEGDIPAQASSSNQLADKNFVNSSIATNTANFIGTFNSVAALEAYSGTLTNNDYAFVVATDAAGNTVYNRYKWNGTAWLFEYALNNSSFTSNQWASINSGATTTNIGQIATNTTAIAGKQDIISDLATIRSGATAGATAVQPADLDTLLATLYPVGSIYIGTQSTCPLATLISGSTWVKVSEGRVLQGSDSGHSAGSTIAAGLPNITGYFKDLGLVSSSSSTVIDDIVKDGAFSPTSGTVLKNITQQGATGATWFREGFVNIDASYSSSIYGNSSTVQPPAYVVNIWRRTA